MLIIPSLFTTPSDINTLPPDDMEVALKFYTLFL